MDVFSTNNTSPNLKRPQSNKVEQVLTALCNLLRHNKTTGNAESSLCPKCSLEDETPNHYVGNCKLCQDTCVKYFGITKTIVHNVVTKCNINKLAAYLVPSLRWGLGGCAPPLTTACAPHFSLLRILFWSIT